MERMKSNFVIFAEPRTGSGVLTSALNKQKDIWCSKELFMREGIKVKLIDPLAMCKSANIANLLKFLGDNPDMWDTIRDKNFKEYLKIFSDCVDKKIFGYKFFEKHFRSFLHRKYYLDFLKENDTKIIVLTRNNILLQYISFRTARSLHQFKTQPKDELRTLYQLNPIHVDYKQYSKYRKELKQINQQKELDVMAWGLPAIHIKYEQFTGEQYSECFANIFSFLNLDFKDFVDVRKDNNTIAGHKKINIYKTEDKISNFTEFKQAAEENGDTETLQFLITQ
jgi:LPS sulfotransferase NodH